MKNWIFTFYLEAGAVNKIASTKLASEVPISVTESTMREESRFKEKECKLRFSCFLQDIFTLNSKITS